MHHKYFIGHRRPEFPLWDGFEFYDIPADLQDVAGSSFEQNFTDHRVFNEYSFLFLLRRRLERIAAGDDLVTICQYRRFVLNGPIAPQSADNTWYPWSTTISAEQAQALRVVNEILPAPGQSYLIGSSMQLDARILGQYTYVHLTRDILRFTSVLVDAGILTNHQAYDFLNSGLLIPSPACGTFRIDAFVQIFRMLEAAAAAFWNNGYKAYQHPYQARVCSFLLELLNSHLLLQYLIDHGADPRRLTGWTTLVSDTPEVRPGTIAAA